MEVLAEVGFEREEVVLFPGGFNGVGDGLVLDHELAEGGVFARGGGWTGVLVVGVGAEEMSVTVGRSLDDELHVGVETVAEAEGEAGGLRGGVALEDATVVEVGVADCS